MSSHPRPNGSPFRVSLYPEPDQALDGAGTRSTLIRPRLFVGFGLREISTGVQPTQVSPALVAPELPYSVLPYSLCAALNITTAEPPRPFHALPAPQWRGVDCRFRHVTIWLRNVAAQSCLLPLDLVVLEPMQAVPRSNYQYHSDEQYLLLGYRFFRQERCRLRLYFNTRLTYWHTLYKQNMHDPRQPIGAIYRR